MTSLLYIFFESALKKNNRGPGRESAKRKKNTRFRNRRRGVSSVIGGIFVLAIMIFGVATIVYVSNLENNVLQAANSAAQVDSLHNQEHLQILDANYTSRNAFTVSVSNEGPQPVEIVSLVIIDSNGHSYVNGTGIVYYNGTFSKSVTFQTTVYPLQTANAQIDYRWTNGTMSLIFVTARGNVFAVSSTAP